MKRCMLQHRCLLCGNYVEAGNVASTQILIGSSSFLYLEDLVQYELASYEMCSSAEFHISVRVQKHLEWRCV